MSKFQLILTGVFGIFIVVGVLIFSAYRGSAGQRVVVTVWGSVPSATFMDIVDSTSLKESKTLGVEYKEINEDDFDQTFIEALASGEGPDLFLLPSDKLVKHKNKALVVPYSVFTERQFKDAFIEGAEIFALPEGIVAMPVSVDPLVMYWNRSIFNQTGVTEPPKYWDEFYDLAGKISKKDGALNIQRSAVAFGEFANISHAKEIISTLVMQAGSPITTWQSGSIRSVFDYRFDKPSIPAEAGINFYTEFSNPAKPTYSWNRSLPSSYNYFLGGDLALYFGFASELAGIQYRNPNLNFDVAKVPSSREDGDIAVYGKFLGLAITKSSQHASEAWNVASILSLEGAKNWSEAVRLPPVRRSLLAQKQTDAFKTVFYDGAIRSRAWLDPEPNTSNGIFRSMIESITSGRARVSEAINKASRELDVLLSK